MVLLDSNVYIDSYRDPAFGAEFIAFHRRRLPELTLSMVVAYELLVGAETARKQQAFRRSFLEPFIFRDRLHVPSRATWSLAAEIDRRLRKRGGYEAKLAQRSFTNDILLAATTRELGATLVTQNLTDFELIAEHLPIKISPPWP